MSQLVACGSNPPHPPHLSVSQKLLQKQQTSEKQPQPRCQTSAVVPLLLAPAGSVPLAPLALNRWRAPQATAAYMCCWGNRTHAGSVGLEDAAGATAATHAGAAVDGAAPIYTPRSTLYSIHCTPHTLHFPLHTLHFTLYTLHFTLHILHFTLHTLHLTLYTPHLTLHTLHFTPYTPHFTLWTLHSTLYTLRSTLHTLHSTLSTLQFPLATLHPTLYTFRFPLHTLHFILYSLHSTRYTLHSTLYTLHSTLYTLHPTLYTLHFTLSTLSTFHSTLYTPFLFSHNFDSGVPYIMCEHSGSWASSCFNSHLRIPSIFNPPAGASNTASASSRRRGTTCSGCITSGSKGNRRMVAWAIHSLGKWMGKSWKHHAENHGIYYKKKRGLQHHKRQ